MRDLRLHAELRRERQGIPYSLRVGLISTSGGQDLALEAKQGRQVPLGIPRRGRLKPGCDHSSCLLDPRGREVGAGRDRPVTRPLEVERAGGSLESMVEMIDATLMIPQVGMGQAEIEPVGLDPMDEVMLPLDREPALENREGYGELGG
jgi:hypothetical protein